jgi:hypothetical protein
VLTVVNSDLGNDKRCAVAEAEALLWGVLDDYVGECAG